MFDGHRFQFRFRLEDTRCCGTPSGVRLRENGPIRHTVRHVAGGTVPFTRRWPLRKEPHPCCRSCSSSSVPELLWRRTWIPENADNDDDDSRFQEEGTQATNHLLESTAAPARSSLSEDSVSGVARTRWIGSSSRAHADTGIHMATVSKYNCYRAFYAYHLFSYLFIIKIVHIHTVIMVNDIVLYCLRIKFHSDFTILIVLKLLCTGF